MSKLIDWDLNRCCRLLSSWTLIGLALQARAEVEVIAEYRLDRQYNVQLTVTLPPRGVTWYLIRDGAQTVTLSSLLTEMTSPDSVARWPQPGYASLQASSYNRASTNRNQPNRDTSGWFADSDGLGFIRTETIKGQPEWVILEHQGPGCLTKLWTPSFYYGSQDRKGPNVRIYLDGDAAPVLNESLIDLVTGKGSVKPPFGAPTARAGNVYLPIPFARSCKVTMAAKPFYYIITVTFWYARPGATHNRPAAPAAAARPIMSLTDLKARSETWTH